MNKVLLRNDNKAKPLEDEVCKICMWFNQLFILLYTVAYFEKASSKCKSGNSVGSPEKCVTYTETCVCQKVKSGDFCSTIHWEAHALS